MKKKSEYNIYTMNTTYHPYKIALTDGQKKKLQKAYASRQAVNLKVKPAQVGRGDEPALGALASAGLSFGAEKVLKEIVVKGFGPKEIELYKLIQKMTPTQKKVAEQYLVRQGLVKGGGVAQYGGFLGMLASIGVPLAIDLVRKIIRKGMQTQPPPPPRTKRSPAPKGKGMQIQPPPFYGSWDDYNRLKKTEI